MTLPEAAGRVVGAALGALLLLVARPVSWLLHEWDDA